MVATIPPNLREFQDDIVDKIVVDFCAQLEEASLPKKKFPFTDEPVRICGGLYCVKADHVEKVGLAGVVGNKGNVPSVYTETKVRDICDVDMPRKFRDPGLGKSSQ